MALGNGWKSATTLVVGGLIGVALAPALTPALTRLARPAAKAGMKAGLQLFERGRLAAAELREAMEDIAAEARAELEEERVLPPTEPTSGPEGVH